MQKYHDEPKQYKGYLKSALGGRVSRVPREKILNALHISLTWSPLKSP